MEHQFLFVVDIPRDHTGQNTNAYWLDFEDDVNSSLQPEKVRRKTARNVWLLDSESALPDLHVLIDRVKRYGLTYQAFLISGDVTRLHQPKPGGMTTAPVTGA